jgi:hypothetical protein
MKPCKVIKVKRRKILNLEKAFSSGTFGPIKLVHQVRFKPSKILKRLLSFWM